MAQSKHEMSFDSSVLQNLNPTGHIELLDVIDNLRAEGLNEHVDLPQLIVSGDQSSGKSSVLAAISGIPFPKKDNLCTRFATEVILRRNDDVEDVRIAVTITPGSHRSAADRHLTESFRQDLTSMDDLSRMMEDAAQAMGLGATGSAFSGDILRMEVRGPRMPQLTIVDLPGLIHSENKFQSAEDIRLVNELVENYMSQERSIILAVISAKNDYANQIVLSKARKVDPDGRRTLGIITKPDTVHPASASELSFISLARNQDVRFSLGWHVIRNQDTNDSVECDRDELESNFFHATKWSVLDKTVCGIQSLRERLSEVLLQQIKKELPGLISEIVAASEDTQDRLIRMGRSRATPLGKRLFVMELGQTFRDLCHAACEGLYEHSFFADSGSTNTNSRRLRAVLQNANLEFAKNMLATPPRIISAHLSTPDKSRELSTYSVVQRAKVLIRSHRGKELPGTFNPSLIGQLFRELSSPWFVQTRAHADDMWLRARAAIVVILELVADEHVREVCMKMIIDPQLEDMQKILEGRLDEYMQTFRRQPITYNHYLTETVQAARKQRQRVDAVTRCRQLFQVHTTLTVRDIALIADAVIDNNEPDMDELAAQNLADYAEAFYKVITGCRQLLRPYLTSHRWP